MEPAATLLTPIVQYGFAGLSAVLLAMLAWCISTIIGLQRETTRTVAANTEMISGVLKEITAQTALLRDTRDRILQRPCIAHFQREHIEDAT